MTAPLPNGYTARRPSVTDADALTELVNACSVEDTGLPIVSPEQTRSIFAVPAFNPADSGWLVTTPGGALVGMTVLFTLDPFTDLQALCVVHPEHQEHGIGEWLLARTEERAAGYLDLAPPDETVTLRIQSWSGNARADALLLASGFERVRVFQVMQIDFDPATTLPSPTPPDGLSVRTFVRGEDEQRTWQADQESFEDHWNHHETSLEMWIQLLIESREDFDPTLWWLVMDGDDVAGVALCDPSAPGQPEYGWVASLGVRRPWRGRGIARLLLATAFAEFQRRGKQGVSLGVDADSPTGANRLYERAGMHPVMDSVVWAKELRSGVAVPA
jgi:mycothiol synthase